MFNVDGKGELRAKLTSCCLNAGIVGIKAKVEKNPITPGQYTNLVLELDASDSRASIKETHIKVI